MEKKNIQFYTYDLPEDIRIKYLLFGLPKIDLDTLKEGLTEEKVPFVDVKEISLKSHKFADEALYIVYFKKGSINLNELRKVKSVCRIIAKWDHFKPKKKSLLQCQRCSMYGHGHRNCHILIKCSKCSSTDHSLADCTVADPRCANCNGPHEATSDDCPKKREYALIRQNIVEKNKSRNRRVLANHHSEQYEYHQSSFPALPRNRSSHQKVNPAQQHMENLRRQYSSQPSFSQPSYSQHFTNRPSTSQQANNDLFSLSEIMELVNEVVLEMSKCRNRLEQFNCIVNLSMKYVYSKP